MANIKFRVAARCEAAGRLNNEDNYQVGDNLNENRWGFTTDREVALASKGALLAVADGMGGMNAGEVAAAIAIETVKEWFSSENLTEETCSSPESIRQYIRDAIRDADRNIKKESAADKEKKGMGSTVVIAWLTDGRIYIGWCGDSRAYRFNPADGLIRLSHDHSYVQELVDAGKLEPELAFDYPDSNIVTRSLGDPRGMADPDVREFPLRDGDVFLLCSDGLSGVLRDAEIEKVISENTHRLEALRDALWDTSCEAGWNDNVTIALCQILSGGKEAPPVERKPVMQPADAALKNTGGEKKKTNTWALPLLFLLAILLAGGGGIFAYKYWMESGTDHPVIPHDSIDVAPVKDIVTEILPGAETQPSEVEEAQKGKETERLSIDGKDSPPVRNTSKTKENEPAATNPPDSHGSDAPPTGQEGRLTRTTPSEKTLTPVSPKIEQKEEPAKTDSRPVTDIVGNITVQTFFFEKIKVL
ncbi:MAG: protein phosphatase 2C domain-containing protein [Tannerella sp.]|nr:protein phosphatase 2C domain-containing protein [Tannerella sp.]